MHQPVYPSARLWEAFGLPKSRIELQPLGHGHINSTWRVRTPNQDYVLQHLNAQVFPDLPALSHNVEQALPQLIERGYPLNLLADSSGRGHHWDEQGCWRLWNYLPGRSLQRVTETSQAAAAGKGFGRFATMLATLNPADFKVHLPRFHDIAWRYAQLDQAWCQSTQARQAEARPWMRKLTLVRSSLLSWQAQVAKKLPLRLAHLDAKLSNLLLYPDQDEPWAVIDLDTLMPGTPVFDFGDLLRSCTCPHAEDFPLVEEIVVIPAWKEALTRAYLAEAVFLTPGEIAALSMAGKYITAIMAVRFLADYLSGDQYYPVARPRHNLDRAANQATLMELL